MSLPPNRSSGPGTNVVICGPATGQYQPRLNPFTQARPCRMRPESALILHHLMLKDPYVQEEGFFGLAGCMPRVPALSCIPCSMQTRLHIPWQVLGLQTCFSHIVYK